MIAPPVMSYHFKAVFKSLTAILSGVDLSVLSESVCEIDGVNFMKPGIAKFLFRADTGNLVIAAVKAIIETETVHHIKHGTAVEVVLVDGSNNDILNIELLNPEVVDFRLVNLDYSKSESVCIEVYINYTGTKYAT